MSCRYETQFLARLAPLDRELVVDDEHDGLTTERWTSGSFPLERENPARVAVLVAHDPELEVGRVDLLYERDGWLCAAFRLRDDLPGRTAAEQTKVGTPVSIGAKIHRVGSIDLSFLKEISLVPRAAYAGAEVTKLLSLPAFPLATWPPIERKDTETTTVESSKPSPPATSDRAGGEVFYGGGRYADGVIKRGRDKAAAETEELHRRLEWAERHLGRADFETILTNLKIELGLESDLFRRSGGVRRVAA